MKGARVYIAGPMTGQPHGGREAFSAAAERLRSRGYVVVSPVELDDTEGLVVGSNDPRTWARALARDLAVVQTVDIVALLPGWKSSRGACLEAEWALRHKISVVAVDRLC